MARPDPEVDIAFLLMDRNKRGHIDLEDFKVGKWRSLTVTSTLYISKF